MYQNQMPPMQQQYAPQAPVQQQYAPQGQPPMQQQYAPQAPVSAGNGESLLVQGRIVWTSGNNLFAGKPKVDDRNKQPVIDQKTGQQVIEYGFGLAVPKVDPRTGQQTPEYTKVMAAMQKEALTLYPSGHIPPGFSMKYKDGDGVDHNGVPFSQREGHANHIIVACVTRIPIKYFRYENGNNILVNDGIKCGDYVNVQLNIKAHPAVGNSKAGLYVNPSAVQLIAPGKEIVNAPSGDQLFGMQAPAYNGQIIAHEVPAMNMQGYAPQGQTQMPPQGQPPMQQQYAPQAPMQQQAPANYNVLPQGFQPPAQGQTQMPPQGQPPMQQQYAPQAPMQQQGYYPQQ